MADPADIAHLLRRTEFVVKPARLAELSSLTRRSGRRQRPRLHPQRQSAAAGEPDLPRRQRTRWEQYVFAYDWWVDTCVTRPRPIQEKMTLFWHGHFTSSWFDGIGRIDHMMHQNQLYRDHGARQLLDVDAGDVAASRRCWSTCTTRTTGRASPNQNFARELMELFTLGVGNYTEDDVEAAARAWTGHNADWPRVSVPVPPQPPRHRQQDVLRHDEELERPGHHRRDPARQRRQAADRGAVHHQEAVGVLRPPWRAGERDQRACRCVHRQQPRDQAVDARRC